MSYIGACGVPKLANVQRRVILLTGLLAIAAAACGATDSGVTAVGSQRDSGGLIPTESTQPGDTVPVERTYDVIDGVVDFGEAGPQHPEYDGFLTAAFGDIESFWAEAFPEAYGGKAFEPLSGGIYAAYPDRQAPIPGCGKPQSSYQDVADGAAFYCIDGDFMAYDDAEALPGLVDLLGKEAVAIVLAHEFGHAIQARADEWNNATVLKEQQADCFAGAWTAHVASGGSDLISFDDAAVRAGLIAMIYVRDPIEGAGLNDPDAHGTGFDRVGAFQDGFVGGVTRCVPFFTSPPTLVDIPFDPTDANAGNLPLIDPAPDATNGPIDIITLIPESLRLFWVALAQANAVTFTAPTLAPFATNGPYPTCAGIDEAAYSGNVVYCAADNTIYWDQDVMQTLSEEPGDMSVGYLFSNAYSEAVQTALASTRTGEPRALFDDCLTGAWVAYIVPDATGSLPNDGRTDTLQLSAGDLDEAVVTAIGRSDVSTGTNIAGSAFEKIDAFRKGVLGGLNSCA